MTERHSADCENSGRIDMTLTILRLINFLIIGHA